MDPPVISVVGKVKFTTAPQVPVSTFCEKLVGQKVILRNSVVFVFSKLYSGRKDT